MQTQAHPTATKGASSALQRCLHGAPLAESIGADFRKGTWTFKVGPQHRVAQGEYVLLPAVIARLALEQEQLETADYLKFPPPAIRRQSTHDDTIVISDEAGYEMYLWRDRHAPDGSKHPAQPWLWVGSEQRVDEHGVSWSRYRIRLIQDDFGHLVEVPA